MEKKMSQIKKLVCESDQPFLKRDVAVITGVTEDFVNQLFNDKLIPTQALSVDKNERVVSAYAVPIVKIHVAFGKTNDSKELFKYSKQIMDYVKKSWNPDFSMNWWDKGNLFKKLNEIQLGIQCDIASAVNEALTGMKNYIRAMGKVSESKLVRGGIPTISGTRIGVYEASGLAEAEGIESALDCYPSLSREDIEDAQLYSKVFPYSTWKEMDSVQ